MIAWARLVGTTAWIMSASLGCAGATPKPSTPGYFRSPSLDYADQPRSATDSEVMGAHARAPEDWLLAGATTDHLGPGWSWRGWKPRFEPEKARAGHGAWIPVSACVPRPERPLADEDGPARTIPDQARLPANRPLAEWVAAMAEVPPESSRFLSCDDH
jgi:hypothetical protein